MTTITNRAVTALLALALVAVTLPATPAAADHDVGPCEKEMEFFDRGYVAASHPGVNQNIRASQTLYLQLFDQGFAPATIGGISLQDWTNGQDAYVVDLPCKTAADVESFCIERLDPVEDRENFVGIPILQPRDHNYRVAFYGPGPAYDLKGDVDAGEGQESKDDCDTPVPGGATFAVVYLSSGTVSGIQIEDDLVGPYTEHFSFGMEGSKGDFGG
ncbi:hypothetical protein BRD56_07940 [Thermoplasmatales archaeon SW_10_69_26]|nr:MAG: hypothetical protein BRD56_07940 [Thermoplasmatales archaeon SW_10_69_26]